MSPHTSSQKRGRVAKAGKSRAEARTALASLIENAFDFLEGALAALDGDPKRSVIDFYTAVELFLKAPLLKEHWTLVVDKSPSLEQFRSGDFVSVSFDESARRLANVLASPLSKDSIEAFNKVRKHRNQYVHFSLADSDNAKARIAAEQLHAWAVLHRLLTHEWADIFEDYAYRTSDIGDKLWRHRAFATAFGRSRLPDVQKDIDSARDSGQEIGRCGTCDVDSMIGTNLAGKHFTRRCLICSSRKDVVYVTCPACSKDVEFDGGNYEPICECGEAVPNNEVLDQLDTFVFGSDDYFAALGAADCGHCGTGASVSHYHDHYLCWDCLEITDAIYACEWCSHPTNKPLRNSHWNGCEQCSGAEGHYRDE